jgi:hypothetical protein
LTVLNWCIKSAFADANHNPLPVLNGDATKNVLRIAAKGGSAVALSAAGTSDPDGHTVSLTWWIYPEAGTLPGATLSASVGTTTSVQLPTVQAARATFAFGHDHFAVQHAALGQLLQVDVPNLAPRPR